MDAEQIPQAMVFTLVCVVAALGLWYCGTRWNRLGFKQIGVMVGIAPVIMLAVQILGPYLTQIEYRVYADGPTARQPSVETTVPLMVRNAEVQHQFNFTPRIRGENPPQQPVHLKFAVRSPKGETLAEGEGDLAPAPTEWTSRGYFWPRRFQPLRWKPLRGQFQPREEGKHTFVLNIPQPVRSVDIFVRELRK